MSDATILHVTTTGETRSPIGSVLALDHVIAVGFGRAEVCHDGETVLDGEDPDREDWLTVGDAEKAATESPDGKWTIEIDAPLWSAKWERQGPGRWACVEAGEGFA
jgi:hypothetical protein